MQEQMACSARHVVAGKPWLGDFLEHAGSEQRSVDGSGSLQGLGVDDDVGQRIEVVHRAPVAHLGPFDAKGFGLAVDALGAGALLVDHLVERAVSIQRDAHQGARLDVDVFDELVWDPAIEVAELNIATSDGKVTQTGTVHNYRTKEEATEAAYRVSGVRSVNNELVVNPSEPDIRSDSAIADSITNALLLDYQVPYQRINVEVTQGHVTLTGSVEYAYQRQAALDDVLKITGITSVDNQITLTPPHASAEEIQRGIARTFARNRVAFVHFLRFVSRLFTMQSRYHILVQESMGRKGACYDGAINRTTLTNQV